MNFDFRLRFTFFQVRKTSAKVSASTKLTVSLNYLTNQKQETSPPPSPVPFQQPFSALQVTKRRKRLPPPIFTTIFPLPLPLPPLPLPLPPPLPPRFLTPPEPSPLPSPFFFVGQSLALWPLSWHFQQRTKNGRQT